MSMRDRGARFALVFVVALQGLACSSTPEADRPRPAGELIELEAFSLRLPTGPDWERRTDALGIFARRTDGNVLRGSVTLTAVAPPAFDQPLEHAYDVLALARMKAAVDPSNERLEVLGHSERLVRHQGMDCAETDHEVREFADPVLRVLFTLGRGRGYLCVHPTDRRRVIELQTAVRNVDGAVSALEAREVEDFLDSVRHRVLSETDDRSTD